MKNGLSMNKTAAFAIDDVLLDVEKAVKDGKTKLLSQTLYQFFPDDDKLSIQDFDVIVLCDQCRHNIPKLTLKSIRNTLKPKGSYFECEDAAGVRAAIQGKAPAGKKLQISANQNGLMDVCMSTSNLHAGKIYVVRVDYEVPLNRDATSHLMFSGAIQPSDYHEFCGSINMPVDAKKTMEVVVFSRRCFTAWFNDPGKNEYYPHAVKPEYDDGKGYRARHSFHHEIAGNNLRARYFSMFVSLCPEESLFPGDGQWDALGDAPLGIG